MKFFFLWRYQECAMFMFSLKSSFSSMCSSTIKYFMFILKAGNFFFSFPVYPGRWLVSEDAAALRLQQVDLYDLETQRTFLKIYLNYRCSTKRDVFNGIPKACNNTSHISNNIRPFIGSNLWIYWLADQ